MMGIGCVSATQLYDWWKLKQSNADIFWVNVEFWQEIQTEMEVGLLLGVWLLTATGTKAVRKRWAWESISRAFICKLKVIFWQLKPRNRKTRWKWVPRIKKLCNAMILGGNSARVPIFDSSDQWPITFVAKFPALRVCLRYHWIYLLRGWLLFFLFRKAWMTTLRIKYYKLLSRKLAWCKGFQNSKLNWLT